MVRFMSLATLVSLILFAEPAWACKRFRRSCVYYSHRPAQGMPHADEVVLKWKFEAGQPFFQELETTTDQEMKVMGQEIKQVQRQTFLMRWTPIKQDSQGNWKVAMRIVGIKMEIDIGGNKIDYDSTPGKPQSPLSDFFENLMKLELTYTLSSDFKVLRVEGHETWLSSLRKIHPQRGPLAERILSKSALKSIAEPNFTFMPGRAVRPGDSWEHERTMLMSPLGQYTTRYRCQFGYCGTQGNLSKIDVIGTQHFRMKEADGLPFTIKKADLKGCAGGGVILFDPIRGRIVSSTLSMNLEGSLTIEVGGMETTVILSETQTTTNRIVDNNPWKSK